MTFSRPTALRKIALIPELLDAQGAMSKHDVAICLGVVARTAQTYLAELKRRDAIHVDHFVERVGGGTPMAMWVSGPEPDGYVTPTLPACSPREDARTRRARRRAEQAALRRALREAPPPPPAPKSHFDIDCPWHRCLWNMVTLTTKESHD